MKFTRIAAALAAPLLFALPISGPALAAEDPVPSARAGAASNKGAASAAAMRVNFMALSPSIAGSMPRAAAFAMRLVRVACGSRSSPIGKFVARPGKPRRGASAKARNSMCAWRIPSGSRAL